MRLGFTAALVVVLAAGTAGLRADDKPDPADPGRGAGPPAPGG